MAAKSANPLKLYLKREKIRLADFAARIGVSIGQASAYCRAHDDDRFKMPRQRIMLAIFETTGGEIQPNDFYGLHAKGVTPGDAGGRGPETAAASEVG